MNEIVHSKSAERLRPLPGVAAIQAADVDLSKERVPATRQPAISNNLVDKLDIAESDINTDVHSSGTACDTAKQFERGSTASSDSDSDDRLLAAVIGVPAVGAACLLAKGITDLSLKVAKTDPWKSAAGREGPEIDPVLFNCLKERYGERKHLVVLEPGPAWSTGVVKALKDSLKLYIATDMPPESITSSDDAFLIEQRSFLKSQSLWSDKIMQVVADTLHLPVASASADLVVASCHPPLVNPDLPDTDKLRAIDQIARALKPGGEFVFYPWIEGEQPAAVREHLLTKFEEVERREDLPGRDVLVLRRRTPAEEAEQWSHNRRELYAQRCAEECKAGEPRQRPQQSERIDKEISKNIAEEWTLLKDIWKKLPANVSSNERGMLFESVERNRHDAIIELQRCARADPIGSAADIDKGFERQREELVELRRSPIASAGAESTDCKFLTRLIVNNLKDDAAQLDLRLHELKQRSEPSRAEQSRILARMRTLEIAADLESNRIPPTRASDTSMDAPMRLKETGPGTGDTSADELPISTSTSVPFSQFDNLLESIQKTPNKPSQVDLFYDANNIERGSYLNQFRTITLNLAFGEYLDTVYRHEAGHDLKDEYFDKLPEETRKKVLGTYQKCLDSLDGIKELSCLSRLKDGNYLDNRESQIAYEACFPECFAEFRALNQIKRQYQPELSIEELIDRYTSCRSPERARTLKHFLPLYEELDYEIFQPYDSGNKNFIHKLDLNALIDRISEDPFSKFLETKEQAQARERTVAFLRALRDTKEKNGGDGTLVFDHPVDSGDITSGTTDDTARPPSLPGATESPKDIGHFAIDTYNGDETPVPMIAIDFDPGRLMGNSVEPRADGTVRSTKTIAGESDIQLVERLATEVTDSLSAMRSELHVKLAAGTITEAERTKLARTEGILKSNEHAKAKIADAIKKIRPLDGFRSEALETSRLRAIESILADE